jgi:polar amino acid transport system substrate-binding protein
MNKTILSAFLFLMLVAAFPLHAAQNVTVYGDDAYPPYSYQKGKEARGIYVDILKKAFAQMPDYNVTIELVPWKRAVKLVETGKGFAFFPPYYRPDLRPWVIHSEPILEEAVVVFCRDDVLASPRPDWPADYKGLTVGTNEGFSLGRKEAEQGIITLEEAGDNDKNVIKVANKRIDCYLNDRLAVLQTIQSLKQAGKYVEGQHAGILEGAVVEQEYGHVGFATAGSFPFRDDFVAKFNETIKQMKASGEIEAIVAGYK